MRKSGLPALLALVAVVGYGCGSAGTHRAPLADGSGALALTIRWPDRSRLVPRACNSIKVAVSKNGVPVDSRTVDRPADGSPSTVSLANLPLGSVLVSAAAYPQAGAQGVVQAQGSTTVAVANGQTTPFTITMASTIHTLDLGAITPITVGQVSSLTPTARDADAALVLVAAAAYTWTSSDPTKATVTATGSVTGVAEGVSTITVTDTESAKSAQTVVSVLPAVTGGAIHGRVTDSGGSPLAGVRVQTSNGVTIFTTATAADGTYRLATVPAGARAVTFGLSRKATGYGITVAAGGDVVVDAVLASYSGADPAAAPGVTLGNLTVDQALGKATLTGTIANLDSEVGTLVVNGDEVPFKVDPLGGFQAPFVLRTGSNRINVRVTNAAGTTLSATRTQSFTPAGGAGPFFRVTVHWDGDADLDLHGWDPANRHASYWSPVIPTAVLDSDSSGTLLPFGPETFTATGSELGTYKVAVNSYERGTGRQAIARLFVDAGPNIGQVFYFGPYRFTGSNSGMGYPVKNNTAYWWRPCDLAVAGGSISPMPPNFNTELPSGLPGPPGAPPARLRAGKRAP